MEEPLALGYLLLPIIGGFLLIEICHWTRFRYRRSEGHRLFFLSASFGAVLLMSTYFILPAVARVGGTLLSRAGGFQSLLKSLNDLAAGKPLPAGMQYAYYSFGSLLLGPIIGFVCNVFVSRRTALLSVAQRTDALISLLLEAHLEEPRPVLLTLASRKCYLGFIIDMERLDPDIPYVKLLPAMSGYRTEEKLELELTTTYSDTVLLIERLYKGEMREGDDENIYMLQTIVKRSEILTASFFDESMYRTDLTARRRRNEDPLAAAAGHLVRLAIAWLAGR